MQCLENLSNCLNCYDREHQLPPSSALQSPIQLQSFNSRSDFSFNSPTQHPSFRTGEVLVRMVGFELFQTTLARAQIPPATLVSPLLRFSNPVNPHLPVHQEAGQVRSESRRVIYEDQERYIAIWPSGKCFLAPGVRAVLRTSGSKTRPITQTIQWHSPWLWNM